MKTFSKFCKSKSFIVGLCIFTITSLFALMILAGCSPKNNVNTNKIELKTDTSNLELIENGKITAAIAFDYPPFESFKSVKPTGLDVDICYQMQQDLDKELVFKNKDFDNVIDAVVNKEADIAISGISVTPEREKKVDFTIPYFEDSQCIIVKKDSSITAANVDTNLTDSSKTVVCQTGSTAQDYAKANLSSVKLKDNPDIKLCLETLNSGEADMFIVEKSYYDNKLTDEYRIVKIIPGTEKYAIAVNKDCPNLKAALNEMLQARIDDGTIATIIEKNFSK